jgi:hypothetical protein
MRALLVLCGGLFLAAPAFAYSAAPPHSFTKPTANGKYVLVMLQQHELPGDKGLKEKYGRSGLFPADDPTKPLWVCEGWNAQWDRNVFASDDGIFALRVNDLDPGLRHWLLGIDNHRIPPKNAGWENEPALIIYQNGKPLRTITLREAFDTSQFTDRDCYCGPIVTIDSFQDAEGRATISTEAGGRKRTTTIAFRTGEVTEKRGGGVLSIPILNGGSGNASGSSPSWVQVILTGLLVVVGCVVAFVGFSMLLIRKKKSHG